MCPSLNQSWDQGDGNKLISLSERDFLRKVEVLRSVWESGCR
jgi:hypothetical protein